MKYIRTLAMLSLLSASSAAHAQQQPLQRIFKANGEEHYKIVVSLKVETRTVSTETIGAQTYVTPVLRVAEVSLQWRASRSIKVDSPDSAADIREALEPLGDGCVAKNPQIGTDMHLQASLERSCATLLRTLSINYSEGRKGQLHESGDAVLPDLGEDKPQLLALWLRRAIRPNVVLPDLPVQVGVKTQRALRPGSFSHSEGSESTEWLEAQEDSPALTLHVVQELRWDEPTKPSASPLHQNEQSLERATFFADSVSTLSLLDASVLHAFRSATRTTSRILDVVPGLPNAPEFLSKLSVSVEIERLS